MFFQDTLCPSSTSPSFLKSFPNIPTLIPPLLSSFGGCTRIPLGPAALFRTVLTDGKTTFLLSHSPCPGARTVSSLSGFCAFYRRLLGPQEGLGKYAKNEHPYREAPQREAQVNSGGLSALSFSGRNSDPFDWTVQFGELTSKPSFWNLQAYSNRYQVEDIFLSPKYTRSYPHDIALLKLSSPVNYNNHIQPICLLNSTYKFENRSDCWVTGWGTIGEDESEAGNTRGRVGGRHLPVLPHQSLPGLCHCSEPLSSTTQHFLIDFSYFCLPGGQEAALSFQTGCRLELRGARRPAGAGGSHRTHRETSTVSYL